jgi:hypothetical protein
MDLPVKPETLDNLLWLITIALITLLASITAFFVRKTLNDSHEKTTSLENALKENSIAVIKLTFQIENIEKDLNNLGVKIRSMDGSGEKRG